LEQLTRLLELRLEREIDAEELYLVIIPTLELIMKAAEWMVKEDLPEKYKIAAVDVQQSWDNRLQLLAALLQFIDQYLQIGKLLVLAYSLVHILCTLDPACLDDVLRFLYEGFVSREAVHTTRFAVPSALVLAPVDGVQPVSLEVLFFDFVRDIIREILNSDQMNKIKMAIDLAILVLKEAILLESPVVINSPVLTLECILEHPQFSGLLDENRRVEELIVQVLTLGTRLLDTSSSLLAVMIRLFSCSAKHIPTGHRENLLRSLGEKTKLAALYINQIIQQPQMYEGSDINQLMTSLVQRLLSLTIIFADADTKMHFCNENGQVLQLLHQMALLAETENSPFKSVSRIKDFVQLVTSLPNT